MRIKVYVGIASDSNRHKPMSYYYQEDINDADMSLIEVGVPTTEIKQRNAICQSWRYGLLYEPISCMNTITLETRNLVSLAHSENIRRTDTWLPLRELNHSLPIGDHRERC
jgi:hypothetical protein